MFQEPGAIIIGSIITGFASIVGAAWGAVWNLFQKREQDEEFHRESHNLALFEVLASDNPRLQLAAASTLIERLNNPKRRKFDVAEHRSIVRALISVTKDHVRRVPEEQADELKKFIADHVLRFLGAVTDDEDEAAGGDPKDKENADAGEGGDNEKEKAKREAGKKKPSKPEPPLTMGDFDWQGVRLDGAWLPRLDAPGVDFWKASLNHVGMKQATLTDAVLKEVDLRGSVMRNAVLTGADLRDAKLAGANLEGAKLEGAKLEGATYRPDTTTLPHGFDAAAAGMIEALDE